MSAEVTLDVNLDNEAFQEVASQNELLEEMAARALVRAVRPAHTNLRAAPTGTRRVSVRRTAAITAEPTQLAAGSRATL